MSLSLPVPSLPRRALIRPGRFDRRVVITLPDVRARHDILRVHSTKVKLSPDVDLEILARGTSGFSGGQGRRGRKGSGYRCACAGTQALMQLWTFIYFCTLNYMLSYIYSSSHISLSHCFYTFLEFQFPSYIHTSAARTYPTLSPPPSPPLPSPPLPPFSSQGLTWPTWSIRLH